MGKHRQGGDYDITITRAKILIKILSWVFVLLVILLLGKAVYSLGYDVFNQEPMDTESNAQEVSITLKEGMAVYEVGKLLKREKLIKKPLIFWVQEKLSDYRGKIKPGTYTLNSAQTVDDMLRIFAEGKEVVQ